MQHAVEVDGLYKRFGRSWALVDLSFQLRQGQSLVVAGRNGSGKSTLLRVLAGSLEGDLGSVQLLGKQARWKRRGQAGLVSHHTFTYDSLDGLQNLQIAARLLGKGARRRELLPLLEEVGLAKRADDPVHTYSAGMRKRLSLARLALQDPPVVLLDEPFGQLDPPGFLLIEEWVRRFRAEGRTLIVASHQLERSAALCERAIALEQGRLLWSGAAPELPKAWSKHLPAALSGSQPVQQASAGQRRAASEAETSAAGAPSRAPGGSA